MHTYSKIYLTLFLVLLVSFTFTQLVIAQPSNMNQATIKEKVTKINRQLFDALIDGDTDEIVSLYTTNGTLFPPNGQTVKGKKAIKNYWLGSIKNSQTLKVETQNIDFELYGDTAYESGSYQLDYKLPDESEIQTAKGIYLIIWKKVDGTWKLHIDMWN